MRANSFRLRKLEARVLEVRTARLQITIIGDDIFMCHGREYGSMKELKEAEGVNNRDTIIGTTIKIVQE